MLARECAAGCVHQRLTLSVTPAPSAHHLSTHALAHHPERRACCCAVPHLCCCCDTTALAPQPNCTPAMCILLSPCRTPALANTPVRGCPGSASAEGRVTTLSCLPAASRCAHSLHCCPLLCSRHPPPGNYYSNKRWCCGEQWWGAAQRRLWCTAALNRSSRVTLHPPCMPNHTTLPPCLPASPPPGDVDHLDISVYAFEKLAPLKWGVIPL